MKLGVQLPQWGPGATRAGVLDAARCVEAAGLDSVWVADHVVHPRRGAGAYPYGDGPPFRADDGFLEAFSVLAAAGAVTERVELGTSVLVLPMRDVLLTAKTVATVDVLTGGRTVLAVGAGWWREELAALGQPFERRGRRLDEQIAALRMLWRAGEGGFAGEEVRFEELVCRPLPAQPAGPRILIGGTSERALRRAARLGDGWHTLGAHEETLRAGRARIAAWAQEAGRDPAAIALSTQIALPADRDAALRRLERLARLGVDHCVVAILPPGADGVRRVVERLAGDLRPALGR